MLHNLTADSAVAGRLTESLNRILRRSQEMPPKLVVRACDDGYSDHHVDITVLRNKQWFLFIFLFSDLVFFLSHSERRTYQAPSFVL